MEKFKEGDNVYAPFIGTEVFKLHLVNEDDPNSNLEIKVPDIYSKIILDENGLLGSKLDARSQLPRIHLATEDNKKKLEDLYGVEFEKPKRKLKGSELCKRLLKTQRYVLCFVSDCNDNTALKDRKVEAISRVSSGSEYFMDLTNIAWVYAVPINPETLEPLEMEIDYE